MPKIRFAAAGALCLLIGSLDSGMIREASAEATLTVRLPKTPAPAKSISVVAVAVETGQVLASLAATSANNQVTLTVRAVPQVVFADWRLSDGKRVSGYSPLLRPVDGRTLTVDLAPRRAAGMFPVMINAAYRLGGFFASTAQAGGGATAIGVPANGFTVKGLDLSGMNIASVVTTEMIKGAHCYGEDGGFVVVETDPAVLAILKAEIDSSNSPGADPSTRLTNRYVAPSRSVSGSWSSDGTNVTVTLRVVDSQGRELLNQSATGPLNQLLDINASVASALAAAMSCSAPEQFRKYADVAEWTGAISYVYRASWDKKYPGGGTRNGEQIERGVITLHLDKVSKLHSGLAWRGTGWTQASFDMRDHTQGGKSQVDGSIGPPSDTVASADGRFSQRNNWLEMDFAKGTFKAGNGGAAGIPYESTWTVHGSPPNTIVSKGSFSPSSNRVLEGETLPKPAPGAILTGSKTVARGGNLYAHMLLPREVNWELTASWSFAPVWRDAELVVSIDGYENWLPQAGRDQRAPGNSLTIHAVLRSKDDKPLPYQAKKITFELLDTSREPGVCVNWPPKKALPEKEPYDLRFLIQKDPKMRAPDEQGQTISTVEGKHLQASAVLSSFDWGGWSTLKVTAELQDGRLVTGHLEGERGTTQILLPKRAKDSKIADVWKQNAGAFC